MPIGTVTVNLYRYKNCFIFCRPLYSRRRCSVGVLQPLGHGGLGAVSKETREDVTAGDDLCTDTAEASYKHKCIAKDISDMVYYTEPVKFNGFKVS